MKIWYKNGKKIKKCQINETFIRIFCKRAHSYYYVENQYTLRCTCTTTKTIISIKFKFLFFITFQNGTKWVLRFHIFSYEKHRGKKNKRDSMHVDTLLFHIICNNEHTKKIKFLFYVIIE